jgi:Asp/Glu/hydantoin racemase
LIPLLKSHTNKPIVGIFEASVTTALLLLRQNERWGIVSTGDVWQELLTSGVEGFLGVDLVGLNDSGDDYARHGQPAHFAGVATTGLNATELHTASPETVKSRIKIATKSLIRDTRSSGKELGVVCLGCAGMAGMEELVREAAVEEMGEKGRHVRIVDGVKAGVGILEGLIKGGFT